MRCWILGFAVLFCIWMELDAFSDSCQFDSYLTVLTLTFCICFHSSSQNCNLLTTLIQNLLHRHWYPLSVELHLLLPFSSATHLPKRGFIFKSKMDAAGYKRNCWNLRRKAWVLWRYFLWDYTNTLWPVGHHPLLELNSNLWIPQTKHNCGKQLQNISIKHFGWVFLTFHSKWLNVILPQR